MYIRNKSLYKAGLLLAMVFAIAFAGRYWANASDPTWDSDADISWYDPIYTTYTIDSPQKLAGVAKLVNEGAVDGFAGKILEISGTMDLKGKLWVPIGTETNPFRGALISNGGAQHEIRDMTVKGDVQYAGLVGNMSEATVGGFLFTRSSAESGFGLIDVQTVTGSTYAGAAVAHMTGVSIVYDITNQIPVKAASADRLAVGGVVGAGEGTIANSVNAADRGLSASSSTVYAGGIAGYANPNGLSLKKITNNSAVNAFGLGMGETHAGGIVGYSSGLLRMNEENTPIANTAAVSVHNGQQAYAGGIVGRAGENVVFSTITANSGPVLIEAPEALGSSAGGLIGAVDIQQDPQTVNIGFTNTGSVTNHGGTEVRTGSLAGYVNGMWTWAGDYTNQGAIAASGKQRISTGGLIGLGTDTLTFTGAVRNAGAITVSGGSESSKPDEAFTGGLVGRSESRVLLENGAPDAYGNSGAVTVTGGRGLYTGGLIGNRAYGRMNGPFTGNVASTGAIAVSGIGKLYTGGFFGTVPDEGADKTIDLTVFGGTIQVQASAPDSGAITATGGIVGYYVNNSGEGVISRAGFQGTLEAAGGMETYSGGIAGYLAGGTITDSASGTPVQPAAIRSDGVIGGLTGAMKGTVDKAAIQNTTLRALTDNSLIGGVSGIAEGTINGVTVGSPTSVRTDDVRLEAAAGRDRLTAGGIVGRNENGLTVTNSLVNRTGLINEAGRSEYQLGGIAGLLTAPAKIGTVDRPVLVKNMTVQVKADRSAVGGAVGINRSADVYAAVEGISMEIAAAEAIAGGLAGVQHTPAGTVPTGDHYALSAKNIAITATGASLRAGGLFGENREIAPRSMAENVKITSAGANSRVGGAAGRNTGTIADNKVSLAEIAVSGPRAEAGGIAGRSEPASAEGAPAVIQGVWVHAGETPLVAVTGTESHVGGIVGYARQTDLLNTTVEAVTPDYATILLKADRGTAGGIAGRAEDSRIVGDTFRTNVENLMISANASAANAYAGGIAGYNARTLVDKMVGSKLSLILNGPMSTAGGIAGYNRSTATAVLSNNYVTDLNLRANASAAESVAGGFVGLNDRRDNDPAASPDTEPSTIQNSRVVGSIQVSAANAVTGGMAGENRSLIANNGIPDKNPVVSRGGGSTAGGFVGRNTESGTLYYTYSNAALTAEGTDSLAGGLAGENKGRIIASYIDLDVTGAIQGTADKAAYLGGLVGRNEGTIARSYTAAKVTSTGAFVRVGGLVGEQAAGSIADSYAGKEVSAAGANSYAGGFAGRIVSGSIANSYSAGQVLAADSSYAGGFAGRYDNESKELLYKNYYVKDEALHINTDLPDFAEGNHRWLNVHVRLSTLLSETLQDRNLYPGLSGWDFSGTWKYGSPNAQYRYPELIRKANSGSGGTDNNVNANINWYMRDKGAIYFDLKTEAELAGLAAIVNGAVPGLEKFDFAGRTVRIVNPIHIQSDQWVPIGADESHLFQGAFEGGNHLIDGLTVKSGHPYAGLFGVIGTAGKVQNIRLEPAAVEGTGLAGALAGWNQGSVSGISVRLPEGAKVSGQTAGGILGKNTGPLEALALTMEGSAIEAALPDSVAGGLIGDNTGAFHSGLYTFTASGSGIGGTAPRMTVGGLIGKQTGGVKDLKESVTSGFVLSAAGSDSLAGGLIGHLVSGTAENLSVTFTDGGKLSAVGSGSVLGGVIGKADADSLLRRVSAEAVQPGVHLVGGGTAGGIVGEKSGKGTAVFDVEEADSVKLVLASAEGSTETVLGGIAGKLTGSAVHRARFEGELNARGTALTAGGIAGVARDSILYEVESSPVMKAAAGAGDSSAGGIAGILVSSDMHRALDFGKLIPFYHGVYDGSARVDLQAAGTNQSGDLAVGGITGKNLTASIYFAHAEGKISVQGAKIAAAGGIAGFHNGILVNSDAAAAIDADTGTVYHVGGAVGLSAGGEIHYTHTRAPDGETVRVGSAVTKPGVMPATHAGGFVGKADKTVFTHSTADTAVQVTCTNQENTVYAGGFAGLLGDSDLGQGTMRNVGAQGAVEVKGRVGTQTGGFAGSIDRYEITGAYAQGNVNNEGFDTRTGGFAGAVERKAAVKDAYALQPAVSAKGTNGATRAYAGGFAGYNDGALTNVYSNVPDLKLAVAGANAYMGSLIGYQFRDGKLTNAAYMGTVKPVGHQLGTAVGVNQSDFTGALPFESWLTQRDSAFLIRNDAAVFTVYQPEELQGAVLLYNDTDLDYFRLFSRTAAAKPAMDKLVLGASISLKRDWVPFAAFRGEFDGQGNTLSGLRYAGGSGAVFGLAAENFGMIANVVFDGVDIHGAGRAGAVAGMNRAGGTIQHVKVTGKLAGSEFAGGIAGLNEGRIHNATVGGEVASIGGGVKTAAGGIAGVNAAAGSITESEADVKVHAQGGEAAHAGGIAGANEGEILRSNAKGEVAGSDAARSVAAGGIAGTNLVSASIAESTAAAEIRTADGDTSSAGGIAGINEGEIRRSYTKGGTVSAGAATAAAAGGIAGTNGTAGRIAEAFSYARIQAVDAGRTIAGGIAGRQSGSIANVYVAGKATAEAAKDNLAWAGGIAGYADGGSIRSAFASGEAIAASGGMIVPGKAFFGGLVGQADKAEYAAVGSAFNKQMLKTDTAYYDGAGKRISDAAAGREGREWANGQLPSGFDAGVWTAVPGYYPQLKAFQGTAVSKLSAAAVILHPYDLLHRAAGEFRLTRDAALAWTADSKQITIRTEPESLAGTFHTADAVELTVRAGDLFRTVTINGPMPKYSVAAQAPAVLSFEKSPKEFYQEVKVEFAPVPTGETIYYTMDGSTPNERSLVYTGPIELKQTQTIKAIAAAAEKEPSSVFSETWTKKVVYAGGGGFFFQAPAITAKIGDKTVAGDEKAPATVARNSKLTLDVPEGYTLRYTTDGSTPTKDSPVYKDGILITGNMTVKVLSDKDGKVTAFQYRVENAGYQLKNDAGKIKYMTGYANGLFKPDTAITRYELIDVLAPLLDKEDVAVGNLLRDVAAGKEDLIAFFNSAGIIEGYPDGTFGGGRGLTRAEFVVVMSRVLKLDITGTGETVLSDVAGDWSEKYVNAFTRAGYVDGYPDGTFKPNKEITRAEAVVLINKVLGVQKQNRPASFGDLPAEHWAFEDIMTVIK